MYKSAGSSILSTDTKRRYRFRILDTLRRCPVVQNDPDHGYRLTPIRPEDQ